MRHTQARSGPRSSVLTPPESAARTGARVVGLCLCDVFSDNHDVIAADGRAADVESFRGAGAFLDEHLTRDQEGWREGDYPPFYLGTIWISRRASLTPVYAMIFRRLKALGTDWVYHVPELGIVELSLVHDDSDDSALCWLCVSHSWSLHKQHGARCQYPKFVAHRPHATERLRRVDRM